MYFPYTRDEAGALEGFLLKKHFTPGQVAKGDVNASNLQDYVASAQTSVRKWHEIHFPHRATLLGDGVRRELERLGRLSRGAFEPLIMAALQTGADEGDLKALLRSAERFVFVVNRLCRTRADAGDYEFYRLAHELFSGQRTLEQAVRAIDARTDRHFSKDKAVTEQLPTPLP